MKVITKFDLLVNEIYFDFETDTVQLMKGSSTHTNVQMRIKHHISEKLDCFQRAMATYGQKLCVTFLK